MQELSLLRKLLEDSKQLEAINLNMGPAFILAGPGSGKTFVLTHHIMHLIESGTNPNQILVITFTKAAALEMQGRFRTKMPHSADKVVFGTFHSIFYKLIKFYTDTSVLIIDTNDRLDLLYSVTGSKDAAELYSNKISKYKSVLFNKNKIFVSEKEKKEFLLIFNEYEERLHKRNLIDFDDILLIFYQLLSSDDFVSNQIKNRFSCVCIDEFQDINEVQYFSILKMFENNNIFAVGDEDQSIYGFRGANIEIIKDFINRFENTTVIELGTNYRTYQSILNAANKVISKNHGRIKNTIQNCTKEEDCKHFFLDVQKKRDESIKILLEDILLNFQNNYRCAVLFRTNKEAFEFTRILRCSFNSSEKKIKDAILNDLMNYCEYILSGSNAYLQNITNRQSKVVLKNQLKYLKNLSPFAFTAYIKNVLKHELYIRETFAYSNPGNICDIYSSVLEIAKTCKDLSSFKTRLINDVTEDVGASDILDKIVITTYHQSKGMEYDCVFLPDVYEGNVPNGLSVSDCNIEEERRLFYVAMTRAKEKLFIYTIKNEESGGMLPSRFIKDFIY